MLTIISIAIPFVASSLTENKVDRITLIKLIDGAQQAACQDITLDYEGKRFFPGPIQIKSQKLGPDGLQRIYTGTFRRRSDGATSIDVYTLDKRQDRSRHAQVGILNGRTEFSAIHGDEKKAKITISNQSSLEFAGPGSYRTIWLADWVIKLARSPYLYDFVGYENIDGGDCLVVRFRLVYDDSKPRDKQVSHTFWINLNRGGHVVRHEKRSGDNLSTLTTVRLEKFTPAPGQVAWLPISGREESRVALRDGARKFLDEPVYYETYDMIPVTLRFNQGLKDSAFSVKANPGDAVSDEVRKAKFEYGQYMVRPKAETRLPSDTEVKANLDRMLKDSAVMAKEVKASSPLRDGPGWMSHWPWAFAGLSVAGIGFLYFRRRGA